MIEHRQLIEWKKEYGEIFQGDFGGFEYCFRPLTIHEYNLFLGNVDPQDIDPATEMETEDQVLSACILYPPLEELDRSWPAGLAEKLVEAVMASSGWGSEKELIQRFKEHQGEILTYLGQFKVAIMAAEMGFSWKELDNLSVDQLSALAVAASEILKIKSMVTRGAEIELSMDEPEDAQRTALAEDPLAAQLHQAGRSEGLW